MTYRKKLIEVALPLEDINREAAREKSIRHGHPSTLHLWWARRPLAACRAVLFSSLVDDPSEWVAKLLADPERRRVAEKVLRGKKKAWDELKSIFTKAGGAGVPASSNPDPGFEPKLEEIIVETERERIFALIRELVKWENSNNDLVLNAARTEIARSLAWNRNEEPPTEPAAVFEYLAKHAPPIYDPFCGGGSIPLEAQRLGLEAHASDLNPIPVLITKALIEIPPKFAGKAPVNPEARRKLSASGSWKGAAGLAEDIRYYGQWMRDEAEKGNIAPVDLAQAAIGPGMAVFSRYAKVLEADGSPLGVRTALSLINHALDEVLAEQEGEFDADTRWALAWFDQFGFGEGPYGQAETLSTAKNTSVSGMVDAGILAAKGGKVRLLRKEELGAPASSRPGIPANPSAGTLALPERLTIWAITHHLIRTLDQGEQATAALLHKLGALAEVARDLSYRLYTVCERRKWSQDAIAYNALVLSWPDVKRAADEQKAARPTQGEMSL